MTIPGSNEDREIVRYPISMAHGRNVIERGFQYSFPNNFSHLQVPFYLNQYEKAIVVINAMLAITFN